MHLMCTNGKGRYRKKQILITFDCNQSSNLISIINWAFFLYATRIFCLYSIVAIQRLTVKWDKIHKHWQYVKTKHCKIQQTN